MPTLRRYSACVIACDVTVTVYCTWLKCQLSGDALQDSRSLLNSIKSNPVCFVLLIQTPYPLQKLPIYHIIIIQRRIICTYIFMYSIRSDNNYLPQLIRKFDQKCNYDTMESVQIMIKITLAATRKSYLLILYPVCMTNRQKHNFIYPI